MAKNINTSNQTPTFEQMMALFQETREQFEKNVKEANLRQAEADKRKIEIDKQFKELGKQIGGLGNSFGKYTEGLLGPSIRKILTKQLGMDSVSRNVERLKQKKKLEIDYLGIVNGQVNEAILVEVKSNLQDKHIEQLKDLVSRFKTAFPEYKNKTVYGAIAAINYTDDQKEQILNYGFYFMNIRDEVASLDIPKGFKPKSF